MGYIHCTPAKIMVLRHALDNVVSGTLRTCHGDVEFRTRGHVVKATNKVYRGTEWKPRAGAAVLVDGELTPGAILVDHIEADHIGHAHGAAVSPHLDAIALTLPKHPPASATLRVHRASEPIRLRFAKPASRRDARGKLADEIVHAAYDAANDEWALWTVDRATGNPVARGVDAPTLVILAREAGCDLIAGETARETAEQHDADEKRTATISSWSHATDNCPF